MADDDPGLTPAQEQEVSRRLADARHTEPIPGDVAARLDRVLADLAQGQGADAAPVTDLAARRRRRVTSLLVAAAAVVAVGIGLGQVIGIDQGGGSDSAADRAAEAPAADSLGRAGSSDSRSELDDGAPGPTYAVKDPVRIRPDHFAADVTRVRGITSRKESAGLSTDGAESSAGDARSGLRSFDCRPADWGRGTFVPVRYDGHPGVLVFRRAAGDTQVADLFQCGSADVLRSITLPAR